MADQPRRRRNRPDSKQMWDESERRGSRHHESETRDRRDDRDRGRDRGGENGRRERDRRFRSRSRSPRQDRREKHRDRREPERARDQNIGWAKEGDHHDRRRGNRDKDREVDGGRERDRRRDNRDDGITRGSARDRSPRRSASPPTRSPPSRLDRHTHSHSNSPLPTRPRPNGSKPETGGSSLQFKVGPKQQQQPQQHEEESSSSRGGKHDGQDEVNSRRGRTETPDRGDAMDEDKDEEDDDDVVVEEDDSLSAMQAMMGFGGFGTTKGTHIPGNNAGAVRKEKKTEYRQYMNRVGGFNRPLSPTRQ
ncbi:DUF1777-domain-containing protein [Daldinia bambusicola]|nr:DUF1777-domain-containing protein [Daldinia bambusicola]